jgi:hypothetical protein
MLDGVFSRTRIGAAGHLPYCYSRITIEFSDPSFFVFFVYPSRGY